MSTEGFFFLGGKSLVNLLGAMPCTNTYILKGFSVQTMIAFYRTLDLCYIREVGISFVLAPFFRLLRIYQSRKSYCCIRYYYVEIGNFNLGVNADSKVNLEIYWKCMWQLNVAKELKNSPNVFKTSKGKFKNSEMLYTCFL